MKTMVMMITLLRVVTGNDGENSTCLDLEKFIVSDECGKLGTALSVTQKGFGNISIIKNEPVRASTWPTG